MIILLFLIIIALILYVAYFQHLCYLERKELFSRINTEMPIKSTINEKKSSHVINPIKNIKDKRENRIKS